MYTYIAGESRSVAGTLNLYAPTTAGLPQDDDRRVCSGYASGCTFLIWVRTNLVTEAFRVEVLYLHDQPAWVA